MEKLEELLIKKIRKFKLRVSGLESKIENLEGYINRTINDLIGLKIKRLVLKSMSDVKDEVLKESMRSVENGYLDFINVIVENVIATRVNRKIRWKTRTYKMSECSIQRINDMYINGWKICFTGKLNDNDEIIMFEKPVRIKNDSDNKKKSKTRTPA